MKSLPHIQNRIPARTLWLILLLISVLVGWLLFYQVGGGFVLVPQIIIGIIAYRLHLQGVAQKTNQISEASRVHLATVEALATAIDARDQVGMGHVRRTQIFAVGIGKMLGCSESDINALRTGALLHDIGKLAVPDHILNKPGGLTPAELEKTKIHPQVGASILEKVGFVYPVVPTVKYHHERWDGKGYPEGLTGEEIPLTARILAVADAFDTLRGARPYRAAHSRSKAREILQNAAGTRFDHVIVQTLLRNLANLETEIIAEGLGYDDSDEVAAVNENLNYLEQIKSANREVFSLYELAREFSSSLNLPDTLDMFAKKVNAFVPFDTCSLYLLEDTKSFAVASHVEGENAAALALNRIKVGDGATGLALAARKTVQNIDPDADFSNVDAELAGVYKTMASVPLIADGELIGAVTLYSSRLVEYGEEHIRLLETISRIAADAIGKSLMHDEARTHAMTDPMTGLPNARSLQKQFEKEVGRAARAGSSFQILMLDLDGFKAVNDNFGHKAGDEMLRGVSRAISEQLRDYDFLARYGGDEFVALIPETSPEDVVELCSRIEKAVCEFALVIDEDTTATVGVSLGSSCYPKHGENFDQLIVSADRVMYNRKTSRKQLALIDDVVHVQIAHEISDIVVAAVPTDEAAVVDFDIDDFSSDTLIIELDETHVISSSAIN